MSAGTVAEDGLVEELQAEVEQLKEENLALKLREKTFLKLIRDLKTAAAQCQCKSAHQQPPALVAGNSGVAVGQKQAEGDGHAATGCVGDEEQAALEYALRKLDEKRNHVVDLSSDIVANMTGQYHELLLQSTEQLQTQLETIMSQYWASASTNKPPLAINGPATESFAGNTKPAPPKVTLIKYQEKRKSPEDQYHENLRKSLSSHITRTVGVVGKRALPATLAKTRNAITADMMNALVSNPDFAGFLQRYAEESLQLHSGPHHQRGSTSDSGDSSDLRRSLIRMTADAAVVRSMPAGVKFACGQYLWSAIQRAERNYWSQLQHFGHGAISTATALQETLLRRVQDSLWTELFDIAHRGVRSAAQASQYVTDEVEQSIVGHVASDTGWAMRVAALEGKLVRAEELVKHLSTKLRETENLALEAGKLLDIHDGGGDSTISFNMDRRRVPDSVSADNMPTQKAHQFQQGARAILKTLQTDINAVFDLAAHHIGSSRGRQPFPFHTAPHKAAGQHLGHTRVDGNNSKAPTQGLRRQDSPASRPDSFKEELHRPVRSLSRKSMERAMLNVYSKFNPRLQKRVPAILNEYNGHFESLYDRLALKYGDSFTAAFSERSKISDSALGADRSQPTHVATQSR